ncbi:hypothetical protein GJ496_001053, partial [Pomphorhynchus laevis]
IESQVDSTINFLNNVESKIIKITRPDYASRIKVDASNALRKLVNNHNISTYPHPEYELANTFKFYSCRVGSTLGVALDFIGNAIFKFAAFKSELDQSIRSGYLLSTKMESVSDEIKEITKCRSILEQQREHCEKIKSIESTGETEVDESEGDELYDQLMRWKAHTEESMRRFLYRDVNRVQELKNLALSFVNYYKESLRVAENLVKQLNQLSCETSNCKDLTTYSTCEQSADELSLETNYKDHQLSRKTASISLVDESSPPSFHNSLINSFEKHSKKCEFLPETFTWFWSELTTAAQNNDCQRKDRLTVLRTQGLSHLCRDLNNSTKTINAKYNDTLCVKYRTANPEHKHHSIDSHAYTKAIKDIVENTKNEIINEDERLLDENTNKTQCKAIFKFRPVREWELALNVGDIVNIKNKIDDNW